MFIELMLLDGSCFLVAKRHIKLVLGAPDNEEGSAIVFAGDVMDAPCVRVLNSYDDIFNLLATEDELER